MTLTYNSSSTDGNNFYSHALNYSGTYIYSQYFDSNLRIYSPAMAYLYEDTSMTCAWHSVKSNNDYCICNAGFGTGGDATKYRLANFNGTTSVLKFENVIKGAPTIGLGDSYLYYYAGTPRLMRVVDYTGTEVNTLDTDHNPKYLVVVGSLLWEISGDASKTGAYIRVYNLSGSSISLAASYTVDTSTLYYYINNVGYPWILGNLMYVSVGDFINVYSFNGSSITLVQQYPYLGAGKYIGSFFGIYGNDYFFVRSGNDLSGTGNGLMIVSKQDFKKLFELTGYSNNLGSIVTGNKCYISSGPVHVESLSLYDISNVINNGSFKADWI